MRELEIFSERSYTSVIVFLFNIIAILVIFILLRMKKITLRNLLPHVNQKRVANIKFWIFCFYVIILILITNVIISGSPLWIRTINKTTFWTIAKFPFLAPISSQIPIIAIISGMFFLNNEKQRKSRLIKIYLYGIYMLLMIYLILLEHKFGQLLIQTYLFFLPQMIYQALMGRVSMKKGFLFSFYFISASSIPLFYYFIRKYGNAAYGIMRQRIFAMEGQITYVSIQNYLDGSLPNGLHQLSLEFKYIFGLISNNSYVGMTYLMSIFMQEDYFNYYQSLQVNLAQGYIAMLLHLYNNIILALFIHTIFIVLFSYTGYMVMASIMKYDFILTFLYLKIFFSFFSYYSQGYTTAIFNVKTIVYVYLIIITMVIRGGLKKREKSGNNRIRIGI